MKEIRDYYTGDQIPSNAKYLNTVYRTEVPSGIRHTVHYYEIPLDKEKSESSIAKDKETEATIVRVITYLNNKTGSSFTAKAKATTGKIRQRINEGATPDNFKTVIDNMCAQWLDNPEMRMYLRPETLFSNKFWGYLSHKSEALETAEAFDELDKLINEGSDD